MMLSEFIPSLNTAPTSWETDYPVDAMFEKDGNHVVVVGYTKIGETWMIQVEDKEKLRASTLYRYVTPKELEAMNRVDRKKPL